MLVATACSGTSGNARTADVEPSGDGVLRVGLLLDSPGTQGFINDSEQAAARLAVSQINASGGFKGKPVALLPVTPGTDTRAQSEHMVAAGADVVIGPTDSSNAVAAIDVLSKAKVTLISPANTAPELSSIGSGGYYFRTQASSTLQAQVLAKRAAGIGARVAVLHESGSYGTDVSHAVSDALKASSHSVAADAEAKPGTEADAVKTIKDASPDAVILVARGDGQAMLAELANAGIAGSKLVLSDGATGIYGTALASTALQGATGLLPGIFPTAEFQQQLLSVSPALKDMTFAGETYDAVMLAALAATAANDDAGASIAAKLLSVSGGRVAGEAAGVPCTGYPDCSQLLMQKKHIDYDGISGAINFNENGDITAANYVVYSFGADNKPVMSGTEKATAP
ncbi:ABC transporter substrate-binding protein [Arthrobacter sp. A5]|uniref:ABC transporter substrate-binding protein n=1 Tax=Arthrobacter sp. A5 TaxID=576926 RepID=UPI003DA905C0